MKSIDRLRKKFFMKDKKTKTVKTGINYAPEAKVTVTKINPDPLDDLVARAKAKGALISDSTENLSSLLKRILQ